MQACARPRKLAAKIQPRAEFSGPRACPNARRPTKNRPASLRRAEALCLAALRRTPSHRNEFWLAHAPSRLPRAPFRSCARAAATRGKNARIHLSCCCGETASDTRQKRGLPPIAAISLRLRARARSPMAAAARSRLEVHAFNELVGGEQKLFAGFRAIDRAIVSDAQDESPNSGAPSCGSLDDPVHSFRATRAQSFVKDQTGRQFFAEDSAHRCEILLRGAFQIQIRKRPPYHIQRRRRKIARRIARPPSHRAHRLLSLGNS